MNLNEIAGNISDLLSGTNSAFLRMEPEILDFTEGAPRKIHISTIRGRLEFAVSPENILPLIGLFDATIFDPERVERLYCWNIKSLVSYAKYFISKFVTPKNNCIDLKPIEGFLGIRLTAPKNFAEAIDRTKQVVKRGGWHQVYKSIHLPLSLRVLPAIETTALLNSQSRKSEYPCYEIEGQTNGRLNCRKEFTRSYLPQTLGPDVKRVLRPKGYGLRFVTADYRHCEVTVLQWLSKDEKLFQILESGDDLHRRIYEIVTGDVCDTETKRNLSKKMFLPVMYGCGPKGLSSNMGVSESVAGELIGRIHSNFSTASKWMQEAQSQAKRGPVLDYFGRPRIFKNEEAYQARNFVVQAVAATVCQEKLIELYNTLEEEINIIFSVHDGFALVAPTKKAKVAYQTIKKALESESRLCPGLQMNVEVKFGARLDEMKVLWK